MRQREPWEHEWSKAAQSSSDPGGVVKACLRPGCTWQMKSRPNSNRYRNGFTGKWMHSPKACEGKTE